MIEKKKESERKLKPEDYEIYHDPIGVTRFLPPKRARPVRTEMNNVILERPRCLNMFLTSTFRVIQVGERTWAPDADAET